MLDRDLAKLYGVEVKHLKRQVRRNIDRFPEDFMFELTTEEYKSLRSHFVTLKRGKHSKYLPYAFTEQGVAMLYSVLNSENIGEYSDNENIYADEANDAFIQRIEREDREDGKQIR